MLTAAKEETFSAPMVWTDECVLPLAASGMYPKTRVWGSKPQNVHCSSATARLKIGLRWGCEESREKTAVGSGVTFKYDPFGRRIYKSSSAATSIYAYDDDGNLVEETNGAGTVVARYSQGLNLDEPLVMLRSSTTSYYHADGLGSITSLSSAAGALGQTYTFDSFGKLTASSGSVTNPFQYAARESDAETNLYFYRSRYYDPSTGRFMNEDVVRFDGGPNFYSYVKNSPVSFVDPLGLNAQPAPPGLIGQLQNLFPGSTFNGTTLVIPMSCSEAAHKLQAQGYQNSNSGYAGPGSTFWNPINHGGGWEWRTSGPGFHFRMPYPPPQINMPGCGGPCLLDQFHLDQYNPLEPGQMWQHLKCDFLRACGSK